MEDFEAKIKNAIELIRPSLQNDGGDIQFVRTEGKKVFVKLQGACAGCMMAAMTLKGGVKSTFFVGKNCKTLMNFYTL